jgi:hypothetical protein
MALQDANPWHGIMFGLVPACVTAFKMVQAPLVYPSCTMIPYDTYGPMTSNFDKVLWLGI